MNTLTDRMRIAILPLDIQPNDKEANMQAVADAFAKLPEQTDIVVLPELFTTGFTDDEALMKSLAERNTGETIDFIKELAKKHMCAIAGGFDASTPPHIYNRAFFIEPSGEEYFYDKRHLFSISSEAKIFTQGRQKPKPVRFRGWNIAMIVCYDLRFPVWCRSRRNSYDMLLVIANWPKSRGYAWERLLSARAVENQCCVVGADRGGADGYGDYDGLAQIYDCYGRPVGVPSGPFIVADLSRTRQDEYRRTFPVSVDADDFEIM